MTDVLSPLLTDAQRTQFERRGFLHLRNVLDADEVALLLGRLQNLHEQIQESDGRAEFWRDVFDAGNDRDLSMNNALRWCPGVERLLDHPGVLGAVLGLMGPYIQCIGSEIYVRYAGDDPLFDFHTDVGPALRSLGPATEKVVQMKAQFFLTDVSRPDSGNFAVAPGSHLTDFPGKIGYAQVAEREQILAAAGDVVLFPLSLGHGVAPNKTGATRYSVILRYAQMFCRPVDYWLGPSDPVLERMSPRQRRMVGDLGGMGRPGDFYGMIPDQLDLMYGEEFSGSAEARREMAAFEQMLGATPYEQSDDPFGEVSPSW